ncbi:PAS domain S-box protein [bacterium]|nr:PAS domain S-box protein [bacterium]
MCEKDAPDSTPALNSRAIGELLESERRYRLLVDNLNDGIVISQNDRFIFFNRRFAEMLEYTAEELRNLTYHHVYTARGLAILMERGAARDRGEVVPPLYETELRAKSGRIVHVEANVTIITYEGLPATFAIVRDISIQKRIEFEQDCFSELAVGLSSAGSLDELALIVRDITQRLFGWDAIYLSCRLSGRTRFLSLLRVDSIDGELVELPSAEVHLPHDGFMSTLEVGVAKLINRTREEAEPGLLPFGRKTRLSRSLMFAPLHRNGSLMLVLSVQSYTPNRYGPVEAALLQRFTNALRPTTERLLAERRSNAFLDLGRKLSACSTPIEAARIVVEVADQVVGWDSCYVDLYDSATDRVETLLVIDLLDGKRTEYPVSHHTYPPGRYIRHVLEHGPTHLERDQAKEGSAPQVMFGDVTRSSESMLFAPLKSYGKVVGFLSTQSYTPKAYDDEDLAVVDALASHCSAALLRASAQKQLHESEERYRKVAETVQAVIMGLSSDFRIVGWNRQAERLYGYTAAQIIGRPYLETFTPKEEQLFVLDRLQSALTDSSPGGFETSVHCRDGSQRIIYWNIARQQNQITGDVTLLCCGQDMTERKHWERELQMSEAYFRAIVEDQTELIARFLPSGTITFVNEAFCSYFGVERWQIVGTNIFTSAAPGFRPGLEQHLSSLTKESPLASVQHNFRDRNGELRWQEWSDRAIHNETGELLGFQTVGRDITKLREAQEALRRSQERYLKLLESSSDVIFQITAEGNVAYANHACRMVLGEEPAALIGNPELFRGLIHPDSMERHLRSLQLFRERREVASSSEPFLWRRRDGSLVYTENRLGILSGGEGEAASLLAVCRDVTERVAIETERRALEGQIQQTQKLESMSVLAGGIAHDFNNLLTGIMGNASLVLSDLPSSTPAHEHTSQIQAAAQRAADLTRQMLAYAGKGSFVVRPLQLSNVVLEMTGILKTVISPRAHMDLQLDEKIPSVQADGTQIGQIVMNLMTNASDALEGHDGCISLSTGVRHFDEAALAPMLFGSQREPGEYVFLEVRDTGCGMDEATKERIFDPFFTRKPTGLVGGRGLGLAAVLGIVRNHRGAIHVESSPGKGTCFTIVLPRSPYEEPAPLLQEPPPEPEPLRSGTILVVDDEKIVQRVARGALARAGYDVLTASDGIEALAVLEEQPNPPSAVLMDLRMPRMDGHTLSAEIQRRFPGLPIVVMSGYSEQEMESSQWEESSFFFLEKPFSPGDLVRILDEAISSQTGG